MAGLGFGNVGFVGSLRAGGGAVVVTPPAGVSRALQFVVGGNGYASLDTPATALGGSNWSIRYRMRPDANPGGSYVSSRANGSADKAAIVYNYAANLIEFFDTNNSTGAAVRFPISIPAPANGSYYEALFTYDGATLRGFLNGVEGTPLTIVFTLNSLALAPLVLGQRNTSGGAECNVTIDYIRETENGVATVTLELNEAAPGPYANTGSYGGTLMVFDPAPNSILV